MTAHLISRQPVGGAQIVLLCVALRKPEGDPNEAAPAPAGASSGRPRQFHVDRAVVKGGPLHDRVCLTIGNLAIFRYLYGVFAEVLGGLQSYLMRNQLINGLSGRY